MYILMIEDNQKLAAAIQAICEEAGHRIDVAYDGQEGLDYAMLAEYDAIILDVMMPNIDGI